MPLPGLEPMADDLDLLLSAVEAALRTDPDEPSPVSRLPDLRGRYLAFVRSAPDDVRSEGLLEELDEIVDAADGLAALAGLDGTSRPEAGRSQAEGASVLHS
jgi:hypothetical protein